MKITSGEVDATPRYKAKSQAEIRELALRVRAGTVFGTWALREHEQNLIPVVFMGAGWLDDVTLKELERDGLAHFYGHIPEDTFERSINGLPMFHRFYYLDKKDAERLQKALDKLNEFMKDDADGQD